MNRRDLFYAVSLDEVEKGEVLIHDIFIAWIQGGITKNSIVEIDLTAIKKRIEYLEGEVKFYKRAATGHQEHFEIAQRQKEELQAEIERLKGPK